MMDGGVGIQRRGVIIEQLINFIPLFGIKLHI
jgi:hypothetical protein